MSRIVTSTRARSVREKSVRTAHFMPRGPVRIPVRIPVRATAAALVAAGVCVSGLTCTGAAAAAATRMAPLAAVTRTASLAPVTRPARLAPVTRTAPLAKAIRRPLTPVPRRTLRGPGR